jgi:hypothetical protein
MANCCNNLFDDFTFKDLTSVKPPDVKGIYVVRIKCRSEVPPNDMVEKTRKLLSGIGWDLVIDFIMSRVERLGNIEIVQLSI